MVRLKQEFTNQIKRRTEVMHEHQSLVFESQHQFVEIKAKAKAKNRLATMKDDMLSQTQKMNWLHLKIEVAEKKKACIDASQLAFIDGKLVKADNVESERNT